MFLPRKSIATLAATTILGVADPPSSVSLVWTRSSKFSFEECWAEGLSPSIYLWIRLQNLIKTKGSMRTFSINKCCQNTHQFPHRTRLMFEYCWGFSNHLDGAFVFIDGQPIRFSLPSLISPIIRRRKVFFVMFFYLDLNVPLGNEIQPTWRGN